MSASTLNATHERPPAPAAGNHPLRILFLTGRYPHPPRKGDQLRAYHQIRHLGRRHRVTLVYLARGRPADHAALAGSCERIVAVPFGRTGMALGLLTGLMSRLPFQAALYRSGAMRRALRELAGTFDLVHVQLARMAHHLDEACCPRPWVVDLVDALSLGMERRIARERGPRRLAARVEAARLRAYEREVTARADASLVASRRDLAALGGGPGLAIVPNAVDLEAFPCAREGREPATVAFTGNMGYFSNVDAAVFFVKEVFPRLRRAEPQARFLIVGARPARAVRALAAEPGVSVTGPVEDVGAFLRRATVAVCPMRTGSGQQIKILEAMASGAPVVATPAEAEQVDGRHDHELLVGADAAELAAHVAALFADPARAERLARNARRLVEARFTWERSVAALEQAYEAALAARRTLHPAAGRRA